MQYKDFFTELASLGPNFSAPQPDFAKYDQYDTTDFEGTKLDVIGYNPQGLKKIEELVSLLEKIRQQVQINGQTQKQLQNVSLKCTHRHMQIYGQQKNIRVWAVAGRKERND